MTPGEEFVGRAFEAGGDPQTELADEVIILRRMVRQLMAKVEDIEAVLGMNQ